MSKHEGFNPTPAEAQLTEADIPENQIRNNIGRHSEILKTTTGTLVSFVGGGVGIEGGLSGNVKEAIAGVVILGVGTAVANHAGLHADMRRETLTRIRNKITNKT